MLGAPLGPAQPWPAGLGSHVLSWTHQFQKSEFCFGTGRKQKAGLGNVWRVVCDVPSMILPFLLLAWRGSMTEWEGH